MIKKTKRTAKLRWHFKRAIMPFMLAFALALTAITPVNATAESATPGSKKISHEARKGSDEDLSSYTKIYTIADLVNINNNPRGKYVLMNDIDITEETKKGGSWDTGHGWTPLNSFRGTLDGNGHKIIGMHIYGTFSDIGDSDAYVGLFRINLGTIKRLGLSNVDINTETISNIFQGYAGGIVGYNKGTISECYVDGVIYNQGDCTGGIAGFLSSYNGSIISNCYNAAKVSGNGIAGSKGDYFPYDKCGAYYNYNIGEVEGYPIIINDHAGNYALKGKDLNTANIDTTILTEAQMRTQSVYVGFDFKNIWEIDPYSSYPYPQLKSNRQHRIDGFDIVTPPSKTNYSQGEKIDLSGGTVNIIYEDGYSTTVAMTEDMLQEYDTSLVGEQTIFVEYGGKKTSFTITVKSIDVTSVKITGDGNSMAKGSSMQLKAVLKPDSVTDAIVQWSSSNNEVATVDEKGMVKALSTGRAEIAATSINGIVGQYSINVTVPCVSINLNSTEVTVYKDASFELASTLSPVDATDKVSYKVANPGIAIVNDSGKITGRAAGETKVTASAGGKTATCNVTVKRKLDDFRIEGVIDKEYTGSKVKQKIKVTDGSTVLDKDKDYKVSYTDNDRTGTATVLVTGLGYYEGSIEKDFKISEESTGKTPASSTSPGRTPVASKVPAASTAPSKSPAVSAAPGKSPTASTAPGKSTAPSAAPSKI
ncbi:MAG TPA: hypothetical protein DCZ23_09365, partial [Lachnospiraceae bacterium]|nr:hypothetical protein [Lachnospiraceae bacterium]